MGTDESLALERLAVAAGPPTPETLVFECHGARLQVTVPNPSLAESVVGRLPPSATILAPADRGDVDENLTLAAGGSLDTTLDDLASRLHFAVAMHARGRLFVHAGVVAWLDRAIVIPGRSRSGKSTLVAALVRAGATYYSDEYAVFDDDGRVHAYPKPLSLRGQAGAEVAGSLRRPDEDAVLEPLRVGLVVVTSYSPGGHWKPEPISTAQAVLALLDNTVVVRRRPQVALSALTRATANAVAVRGVRGEARELADELLESWRWRRLETAGT